MQMQQAPMLTESQESFNAFANELHRNHEMLIKEIRNAFEALRKEIRDAFKALEEQINKCIVNEQDLLEADEQRWRDKPLASMKNLKFVNDDPIGEGKKSLNTDIRTRSTDDNLTEKETSLKVTSSNDRSDEKQ